MARKIKIELVVDANGAVTGIRSVDGALVHLDKQLQNTATGAGRFSGIMKNAFGVALGNIISGLTDRLRELGSQGIEFVISRGAQLEELQSKFESVFGASSKAVDKFVNEFANKAGLTRAAAREYLASTGAILTGAGYTKQAASTVSVEIFKLAADMQSFNNVPITEALDAINASLTGENDQLKKFGIVLNEATVQAKAFEQTGKKNAAALTQQEKATAALAIITEKMKRSGALGDLEKTFKSTTNQARYLTASTQDLADEFAKTLAPSMKLVLVKLIELAQDENFKGFVTNIAAGLATTIQGLTQFITDILDIWREYGDEIVTTAKLMGVLTVAVAAYQLTVKRAVIAQAVYTAAVRIAAVAQRIFNAILKLNPLGLFIAALVAAGTALYLFRDKAAGVGAVVSKFFANIVRSIGNASRYLFSIIQQIPQTSDPLTGPITAGFRLLGEGLGFAANNAEAFAGTLDGLANKLNQYKNDVQSAGGSINSFQQLKDQFFNTISAGEKALTGETDAMKSQGNVAADLANATGDLSKAVADRSAETAKATDKDKEAVGSIARLNDEISDLNKQYEKTADALKRQNISQQIKDKQIQLRQLEAEAELTAGSIALFEERKRVYEDQFRNAGTDEERSRILALIKVQDDHIDRIREQIRVQEAITRLRRDPSTFASLKEIQDEISWVNELIQSEQQGSAAFERLTNRIQQLEEHKRALEQPLKIAELRTAMSNAQTLIERFNKDGTASVSEIEDVMQRLEEGIKIEVDPQQKTKITATIENLKALQATLEKPIEAKRFELSLAHIETFIGSLSGKMPTLQQINAALGEIQSLIEAAPNNDTRVRLDNYARSLERLKQIMEKPISANVAKQAIAEAENFLRDAQAQTLASLNDLDGLEQGLQDALGTVNTEKSRNQILKLIEQFSRLRSEMQSIDSVGEQVFGKGFTRNRERIEKYGEVAVQIFGEVADIVKQKAKDKLDAERDTISKQVDAQKSQIEATSETERKRIQSLQSSGKLTEIQAKAQLDRIDEIRAADLANVEAAAKQRDQIAYESAKSQFEVGKRFAMAQALISGALAVVNALATVPFIPAGLAAAASATIATGFSIAKIKAEKFAIGGTVGKKRYEVLTDGASVDNGTIQGGVKGKDSVLIMAQQGEEIIKADRAQEQRPVLKAINAGASADEVLDIFVKSNKLKIDRGRFRSPREFPAFANGGSLLPYLKRYSPYYGGSEANFSTTKLPNLNVIIPTSQTSTINIDPLTREIKALRQDTQDQTTRLERVERNIQVDGEICARGDGIALSVRKSESTQRKLGRGLR